MSLEKQLVIFTINSIQEVIISSLDNNEADYSPVDLSEVKKFSELKGSCISLIEALNYYELNELKSFINTLQEVISSLSLKYQDLITDQPCGKTDVLYVGQELLIFIEKIFEAALLLIDNAIKTMNDDIDFHQRNINKPSKTSKIFRTFILESAKNNKEHVEKELQDFRYQFIQKCYENESIIQKTKRKYGDVRPLWIPDIDAIDIEDLKMYFRQGGKYHQKSPLSSLYYDIPLEVLRDLLKQISENDKHKSDRRRARAYHLYMATGSSKVTYYEACTKFNVAANTMLQTEDEKLFQELKEMLKALDVAQA